MEYVIFKNRDGSYSDEYFNGLIDVGSCKNSGKKWIESFFNDPEREYNDPQKLDTRHWKNRAGIMMNGSSFKCKVVLDALKEKKTIADLCQEYSVSASQISAWKKQLEEAGSKIFEGKQGDDHKAEIDRLHRVIGKLTAERDFLERVLKR